MRITAYADRLIDDLDLLDWTDAIKTMQRNWIGRSFGARVDFASPAGAITVFTTRPDTLFGATFMVLAPEHPFVETLTTPEQAGTVAAYRRQAAAQEGHRPPGREPREDRRVHRVVRDQPGERRADPGVDRRLRTDGLRHRGDHGGAVRRPARLRVRPPVRAADPGDPDAARRSGSRRRTSSRSLDTATWPDAFVGDAAVRQFVERRARSERDRHQGARASPSPTRGWKRTAPARRRSTTSCATGCSAASATGASRSRSSTTSTATRTHCPTRCCRSSCPRPTRSRRARSIPTTSSPTRRARSTA